MLTLPRGVDAEGIEASFDRGVLEPVVPKPAATRPRRIDIKAGSERQAGQVAAGAADGGEAASEAEREERVLSHA